MGNRTWASTARTRADRAAYCQPCRHDHPEACDGLRKPDACATPHHPRRSAAATRTTPSTTTASSTTPVPAVARRDRAHLASTTTPARTDVRENRTGHDDVPAALVHTSTTPAAAPTTFRRHLSQRPAELLAQLERTAREGRERAEAAARAAEATRRHRAAVDAEDQAADRAAGRTRRVMSLDVHDAAARDERLDPTTGADRADVVPAAALRPLARHELDRERAARRAARRAAAETARGWQRDPMQAPDIPNRTAQVVATLCTTPDAPNAPDMPDRTAQVVVAPNLTRAERKRQRTAARNASTSPRSRPRRTSATPRSITTTTTTTAAAPSPAVIVVPAPTTTTTTTTPRPGGRGTTPSATTAARPAPGIVDDGRTALEWTCTPSVASFELSARSIRFDALAKVLHRRGDRPVRFWLARSHSLVPTPVLGISPHVVARPPP